MYGRSEIDLKFPTPIPVNITYQTAFVDDAGKLQMRKDIYGRDATMLPLLKNSRQQGSGEHGRPCPAELRPAERTRLPAGVTFASDNTYLRSLVLRAAVRRPVDRHAARPGRPPQPQQRVITR